MRLAIGVGIICSIAVSICPTLTLGMALLACAITAVEKAARLRKGDECILRDDYVLGNEMHKQEKEKGRFPKRG